MRQSGNTKYISEPGSGLFQHQEPVYFRTWPTTRQLNWSEHRTHGHGLRSQAGLFGHDQSPAGPRKQTWVGPEHVPGCSVFSHHSCSSRFYCPGLCHGAAVVVFHQLRLLV